MRARLLFPAVAAAVALSIAACKPRPTEPWAGPTAAGGPTEKITIPSLAVTILVPTGTDVAHLAGGATFYLNPGARAGRSFSLSEGEPEVVHEEAAISRQEKTLPGGNLIRYELRTATVGSGGTEAFLDGAIVVGQHVLAVHCHDQAEEPATPSGEWCLEWLATAKPAE